MSNWEHHHGGTMPPAIILLTFQQTFKFHCQQMTNSNCYDDQLAILSSTLNPKCNNSRYHSNRPTIQLFIYHISYIISDAKFSLTFQIWQVLPQKKGINFFLKKGFGKKIAIFFILKKRFTKIMVEFCKNYIKFDGITENCWKFFEPNEFEIRKGNFKLTQEFLKEISKSFSMTYLKFVSVCWEIFEKFCKFEQIMKIRHTY